MTQQLEDLEESLKTFDFFGYRNRFFTYIYNRG